MNHPAIEGFGDVPAGAASPMPGMTSGATLTRLSATKAASPQSLSGAQIAKIMRAAAATPNSVVRRRFVRGRGISIAIVLSRVGA